MDRLPLPPAGRLLGLALAVVALAAALRVGWLIVEPVLPSLLGLLGIVVVYRVMFRGGGKH